MATSTKSRNKKEVAKRVQPKQDAAPVTKKEAQPVSRTVTGKQIPPPAVAIAKNNGKAYKLDHEKKRAKKIAHYNTEFVLNRDIDDMPPQDALQNTVILHDFLRKSGFPDARMTRGYVYVNQWQIKYASHGFQIVDMSKPDRAKVNFNKYHNDMDTPEQVLTFINDMLTKKPKQESLTTAAELGNLKKLANAKTVQQEVKQEKRLFTDVRIMAEGYFAGRYNLQQTKSKFKKRMPKEINAEFMKMVKEFTGALNTYAKFHKKAKPILEKYLAAYEANVEAQRKIREEREERKKMGKFPIPEKEVPINPLITDDKLVYGLKGPGGKEYKVVRTPLQYYMNVLFAEYPKVVTYVNDILAGKIEKPDGREPKMVFAPYTHPDKELLKPSNQANMDKLLAWIKEFFANEGVETVYNYTYTKDFKAGDKVRVWMADVLMWWYGTVKNLPNYPLSVLFEDGEVQNIYSHQKVEKV